MRGCLKAEGFTDGEVKTHLYWARAFLIFIGDRSPEHLERKHLQAFLDQLATDRGAAAATLVQAVRAVEFLYHDVLEIRPVWLNEYLAEVRESGVPGFLSRREIQRLLTGLNGQEWLIASLTYGAGLRMAECLALRVRDIDLKVGRILVRDTDGNTGRAALLPAKAIAPLERHLEERKLLHIKDLAEGPGETGPPADIDRRHGATGRAWEWQYLFPETIYPATPGSAGSAMRPHAGVQKVRQAIARAAVDAHIYKRVDGETLRNSFAAHLIQQGIYAREVEILLGTSPGESTDRDLLATVSPLDNLITG